MENEYICDDRDQLEVIRMIQNMTDEEFEEYIENLKQGKTKD